MQRKDHILVVEPDDLIRGLLERWLAEAGYTVVFQGLRELPETRVHDEAPRLVIADVPSPGTAEKLIQALQRAYPSPILLLSARFRRGLGRSDDIARRLGVCKVLPKPCTRGELLTAVGESIVE